MFVKYMPTAKDEILQIKKGKKKHYEIVLEDTILFAEGGGQPCDHGTINTTFCDLTAGVQQLDIAKSDRYDCNDSRQ